MDKFWEDILLGIENTTEAEWDKLFSDFEKDGYINEVFKMIDINQISNEKQQLSALLRAKQLLFLCL